VKLAAALLVVAALSIVGCAKKDNKTAPAANGSVTDINPTSTYNTGYTPAQAYAPAPAYAAPAPVEQPLVTSTPSVTPAAGKTYTVKKGDNLFQIAKAHYGDGKQWTRIVDANPGLEPAKLKVGQTIQLP
jgi:5'-nucleotidase/UDP-sugar diphosphatase